MAPAFDTRILKADEASIAEAAQLIREGQAVAVPTETVYGLAANATNAEAVARIYQAKVRPSFNPLIVHVSSLDKARELGEFEPAAVELAQAHWPGPLTLVVPLKPEARIASLVTAGLPTIGLRVPAHPVMQALLEAVGRPLAAPSANASGAISPTRAEHVRASLSGRIPMILDGGACQRGLESTIVAATGGPLRLLRPGPIAVDAPASTAGRVEAPASTAGRVEAPGQLASHYAPAKALRIDAESAEADEYLIGFGPIEGDSSLSESGDLVEAAARLFDLLHRADSSDKARIAVAPVPSGGLGEAINDRLKRAAARP